MNISRTYYSADTIPLSHVPVFIILDPSALDLPEEKVGWLVGNDRVSDVVTFVVSPPQIGCVLGWGSKLPHTLVTRLQTMSNTDRLLLFVTALKCVGITMQR